MWQAVKYIVRSRMKILSSFYLTLMSFQTCMIFFFLQITKDVLKNVSVCVYFFFIYTMKVNVVLCCFVPHWLSLCGEKNLLLCSAFLGEVSYPALYWSPLHCSMQSNTVLWAHYNELYNIHYTHNSHNYIYCSLQTVQIYWHN